MNKTPFSTILVRSGFWGGNPPLCPIWSMKFQMIYKNVSNARMTCQGDCWRFLWRNIHARIVLTFENGAFSGFGVENHPFVQYVGTGRNDENRSGGHKTELYVIFPLFQRCIDALKQNLQVWKGLGWFSTPLAPNTQVFEGWNPEYHNPSKTLRLPTIYIEEMFMCTKYLCPKTPRNSSVRSSTTQQIPRISKKLMKSKRQF